jgi:hypothetical protein
MYRSTGEYWYHVTRISEPFLMKQYLAGEVTGVTKLFIMFSVKNKKKTAVLMKKLISILMR